MSAQGEYTADDKRADNAVLLAPESMGDFVLSLEYRIESRTGQGGVYFKYPGSGPLLNNALKIQLSNDAGIRPDLYSTGSLFGISTPKVNAAQPAGTWQSLLLSVRGNRVQLAIDGKQVLDTTFSTIEWPEKGYVALDGVVGGISYRKILLLPQ